MPAELITKRERSAAPPPAPTSTTEGDLREWARTHVGRVRRLRMHVVAYMLGMIVLTPVWALVEWQANGGFERLDWSDDGNPGGWEPWILYVALIWGLFVAIEAVKVYFDRPTTEAEIDRQVRRLQSRG